jgi:SAM-dependent methyltransferase
MTALELLSRSATYGIESHDRRGLRKAKLLGLADDILARAESFRNFRARQSFRRLNPDFILPPTALAYDAFGRWEPEIYRQQGSDHAAYIAGLIKRHRPGAQVICEWGCGPMRLLRHMRSHFENERLVGIDYNRHTIAWCTHHFPGIQFIANNMEPPLPLHDAEADAIYAISVFTHLSERHHREYVADLMRCLSPGGVLIVTLHCGHYVTKLTARERVQFDHGELVVRAGVTEGKRAYVAFHSPDFVRHLFRDFEILEHDATEQVAGFHQDTWVMAKPHEQRPTFQHPHAA